MRVSTHVLRPSYIETHSKKGFNYSSLSGNLLAIVRGDWDVSNFNPVD